MKINDTVSFLNNCLSGKLVTTLRGKLNHDTVCIIVNGLKKNCVFFIRFDYNKPLYYVGIR